MGGAKAFPRAAPRGICRFNLSKNKGCSSKGTALSAGWPVSARKRCAQKCLSYRQGRQGRSCDELPTSLSHEIRGNVHESLSGPYRGLPVRQQKSACYTESPKWDASINTAPKSQVQYTTPALVGFPFLSQSPIQKGKNELYCDCKCGFAVAYGGCLSVGRGRGVPAPRSCFALYHALQDYPTIIWDFLQDKIQI